MRIYCTCLGVSCLAVCFFFVPLFVQLLPIQFLMSPSPSPWGWTQNSKNTESWPVFCFFLHQWFLYSTYFYTKSIEKAVIASDIRFSSVLFTGVCDHHFPSIQRHRGDTNHAWLLIYGRIKDYHQPLQD